MVGVQDTKRLYGGNCLILQQVASFARLECYNRLYLPTTWVHWRPQLPPPATPPPASSLPPSDARQTATMRRFILFCAILALTCLSYASSGDRAREYVDCVASCGARICGVSYPSLPLALRLTRWTCNDDCKYQWVRLFLFGFRKSLREDSSCRARRGAEQIHVLLMVPWSCSQCYP